MRDLTRTILSSLGLLCALSNHIEAQDSSPTPFTNVKTIESSQLDEERAKVLADFVAQPLKRQRRASLLSSICKPIITKPNPSPDQVKLALALVESDISSEFEFEKKGEGDQGVLNTNRYTVTFDLDSVTLSSSRPRYNSQEFGLKVAFPAELTQSVWFEGKDDTSILFLVPPVRDCAMQFIVACPRTYSNARTLDASPLSMRSVRYFVSTKADGLFKAPSGSEGRVQASAVASARVALPEKWFVENRSTDTPNADFKIAKAIETRVSQEPFTAVSAPFHDAVEARLEFGTSTSVLRVVRARSTVEVTPITYGPPQTIRIENSEVPLNSGSCFVISRRKETHY